MVVRESVRCVIWNGIVIFPDIGKEPQELFAVGGGGLFERALVGGLKQGDHGPAILFNRTLSQGALSQIDELGFKIGRDLSAFNPEAQIVQFMRTDHIEPTGCWRGLPE